jgi:hypothetical protein
MLKNILKLEGVQKLSVSEQKKLAGGAGCCTQQPPLDRCANKFGACFRYGSYCRENQCYREPVFTNG